MPTPQLEKLRTVALAWSTGLGPAGFARVVNHFGGTRQVLEASVLDLQVPSLRLEGEQVAVIRGLAARLEDFANQIEDLRRSGVIVVCPWEEDYPALLRDLPHPPPVICMAGRILASDEPAVAIVGTRRPTHEGFAMARRLGRAFADQRTTVVSGLALGCDTAAHEGALEGAGRTIAILGSGLRSITPRENLALARDISQHGAVISEQPPEAEPTVGRLMARNRLQAALSRAVLVVEARQQGGSLETARMGQEQGRAIWAVRWPQSREESLGNERLIAGGARPVSGPEEVPALRLELMDHVNRLSQARKSASGQGKLF